MDGDFHRDIKQNILNQQGRVGTASEPVLNDTGPGSGYTERSELYRPGDDSRTNTIDLKDRKRRQQHGGSVPFAVADDIGREYDDEGQVHVLAGTAPDASRVAYMRTVRPSGDYDPNQGGDDMADYGGHGPGPTQEDQIMMANRGYGPGEDGQFGYQSSTTTTVQRTMQNRTHKTISTEYKTEKDGVIETRIERKMVITSDGGDEIDHDEALAEAIRSVTDMNPDLSVEKIEIKTESETS